MIGEEIRVLDHGFVTLKQATGDDLMVANAARVSLQVSHAQLEDSDYGLINFLMRERHGTPFEHNAFTFHIKAPLFVAREWMRHRIGSYNELSGRYKKFENPDFYLPENWRSQVGKPGAYHFEEWEQTPIAERLNAIFLNHYKDCVDTYNYAIDQGVAKELARLVLPVAMYTEYYWTVNARSLMNFISLRNSEFAMKEIREYAKIVEELWSEEMPITAEAFKLNERRTP